MQGIVQQAGDGHRSYPARYRRDRARDRFRAVELDVTDQAGVDAALEQLGSAVGLSSRNSSASPGGASSAVMALKPSSATTVPPGRRHGSGHWKCWPR